jgi:WD40 repeat protein/O-antigen/teichoic acid export membrane protein
VTETSTVDRAGRHRFPEPAVTRRTGLLSAAAAIAVAGAAVNALGYVVPFFAARRLTPSDLSMLASVLGVGAVASVAGLGLQTAVAVKCARSAAVPGLGRATAWTAGLALAALTAGSPVIALVLHMPVLVPLLMSVTIGAVVVSSRYLGQLQGGERFRRLALGLVLTALARYGGVIAGLLAGAGVVGSLVIGAVVAWLAVPLLAALTRETRPSHLDGRGRPLRAREIVAAGAATLATLAISYGDLVLSRALLSSSDAGAYAVGAVLTKGALWAPQVVTVLVLPKLAQGSRTALRTALTLVAACGAVLVVTASVAGSLAMRVAGGAAYADVGPYAGRFAAVGALYAVVFVLVNAEIAARVRRPGAVLWLALIGLTITASLAPRTLGGVLAASVGTAAVTAVVMLARAVRRKPVDAAVPNGPPYVYLSYSRNDDDTAYAKALAGRLTASGIPVWLDDTTITRSHWRGRIRPRIDGCAAALVIATPAARASAWVGREIARAEDVDRPILVLRRSGRPPRALADAPADDVGDGQMPSPEFIGRLRVIVGPHAVLTEPPASAPVVTATITHVLSGHTGALNLAAWAPDGARLATLGDDAAVRVWDVAGGGLLSVLNGHTGALTDGGWSPDGRRFATAGLDGESRIWDALGATVEHTLTPAPAALRWVGWSADGARLATADVQMHGHISDPETGRLLISLSYHPDLPVCVAWSPEGARLASTGDAGVRIWDAVTGTETHRLLGHTDLANWVGWSRDGRYLASGGDDAVVRIWDPVTGAGLLALTGATAGVSHGQWAPDGERLATSDDATVRVWSARGLTTLNGHSAAIESLAWSPDGALLATASVDGAVRIWDPAAGSCLLVLTGHTAAVTAVAWSPDGRMVASASADATARIWCLDRA